MSILNRDIALIFYSIANRIKTKHRAKNKEKGKNNKVRVKKIGIEAFFGQCSKTGKWRLKTQTNKRKCAFQNDNEWNFKNNGNEQGLTNLRQNMFHSNHT